MLHETVISVVGLLLIIYLFKYAEDLIKPLNIKKKKKKMICLPLMFNDLLGPLIFTIANIKRRPAIPSIVSYDLDSCPIILVIAYPQDQRQKPWSIHMS